MRRFFALSLSIIMIFTFTACTSSQPASDSADQTDAAPAATTAPEPASPGGTAVTSTEKITYNFSSSAADGSAWTLGCQKLAELVKERTNGNFIINVHASDALSGGNQAKGIEQCMNGITEMDSHSNVSYTVMDEKYGVISLPFMFANPEEADPIIQGPGKAIYEKMLAEDNLVLLGIAENGMRQLTTNKAVNSVADLKGMKIRVPGIQMYMTIFNALGANAVTMNFSELFTALQQNTVDGQENPVDLINSSKFYEVQKYLTRWNYSYDCVFFVINKGAFDKLPPDYQQILKEAAVEACAYEIELNRSRIDENYKNFTDSGLTIIDPTPEAMAEFKSICEPVFAQYEEIFGKDIVNAFRPQK